MKFYFGALLGGLPIDPVWEIFEVNEAHRICRRLEIFSDLTYTTVDARLDGSLIPGDNLFKIEYADLENIKVALFEIRQVDFERYWKIATQEK